MTAIIAGVVIVYAALIAALFRFGKPWVNPMFLMLLYYLFNYPVRAYLLAEYPDRFNAHSFTETEILAGLEYSTYYVVLFVAAYLLLLKQFRIRLDFSSLRMGALDPSLFLLTAFLVLLSGTITIGYQISVGGSFSLGADIEELRRPLWVNLAGLPYSLKWFAICMGLLLWLKTRSVPVAVTTALLCSLSLMEAFLTTAKGIVVSFLLLFFFLDNLVTGRVLRASALVIGILLTVFFSSYSYYARYEGGIGLASLKDYVDFAGTFLQRDFLEAVDAQIDNVIERGTYYLDALLLMGRMDASAGSGAYALGSLVELTNLVPRAFGIVSEQYSFDRHVTYAVWADSSFSQVFIGRIGESFFVLGFGGLLYALIHAGIFAFVASRWATLSKDIGGIALYFAVLQGWLYPDASLMYQAKNLITILLCYFLVKAMVRLFSSGYRTAAAQGPDG